MIINTKLLHISFNSENIYLLNYCKPCNTHSLLATQLFIIIIYITFYLAGTFIQSVQSSTTQGHITTEHAR